MRNSRGLFVVALAAAVLATSSALAQSVATPQRGDASAPVVVLLFSDFQCPYCASVEPILQRLREQFPKEVQVVFKHNPLPIHPDAALAHEAAVEAAAQGKFWEMHDLLFANQQRLQKDQLLAHARQLGLDETRFARALEDRRHRAAVERDRAEARALGLNSTPTLLINGRRMVGVPSAAALAGAIRAALNGGSASEGNRPVPANAFDLAQSPVRGSADAPVTIVEFSDFQCGFCARAAQTMARVMAAYPGKVRWVLKHFPLDFHKDAPLAHRAALAAGAQGRFWEMHDAFFAAPRSLARADLLQHAARLRLDIAKFTADLDDSRFQPILDRDKAEGHGVDVDGTPTFFINGERVVGAASYETVAAVIDRAYVAAVAGTPDGLDLAMSRGPLDAPVKIRWFADLTSGLHREALALLRRVVDAHGRDVRLQFLHLPSRERPSGALLHEAGIAGAAQGRFWELHDVLMNRGECATQETLATVAARLGLNRQAFVDTLAGGRASQTLQRHRDAALKLDVRGTPTFFVNDTRIDGVVSFDEFEKAVATELAKVTPRAQ